VVPVVDVVEEVGEHVGSSAVVTVVVAAHRVVSVVVVVVVTVVVIGSVIVVVEAEEDMVEVEDADPDLGPMTVVQQEDEDLDQDLNPEADPETDLDAIRTVVALVLALLLNQEMTVRHPEIEDHEAAPTSPGRSRSPDLSPDPDLGLPMRTARMTVGSVTATATIKLKCCYVVPELEKHS